METKKGNTRLVLVFNHVVVKLPMIKIRGSFKEFCFRGKIAFNLIKENGIRGYYLKMSARRRSIIEEEKKAVERKSKELSLQIVPHKFYEIFGIKSMLFGGIIANWHEYLFYQKTKNKFLMPTYFSFFGFINIQKRGREIAFWEYSDIWMYICNNSENINQPFCDSHTFAEKENFCLDGDKLKMLDYGSRHVHNFLRVNGENLFNNFVKPQ